MQSTTNTNLRLPDPLRVHDGNVADNWQRFREQWNNYEVASDLSEESSEKRGAVFLACIGSDAFDVYRTMQFESPADRKKIDKLIEAFESFCIGAVNVTYERYTFNRRVQENGERFDVFLGEVRRLARSCQFEGVVDSMIRDRIVVGIRDDATRRKLLQVRDLTLKNAIDICKASEEAARQLKVMTSPEEVQPIQRSRPSTPHGKHRRSSSCRRRDQSVAEARACRFCGRQHASSKEACPAFGQKCRRCGKMNHYQKMCRSSTSSTTSARSKQVCHVETEELLAVHTTDCKRVYCNLNVNDRSVNFLIDCGASCNILPWDDAVGIDPQLKLLQPTETKLTMFDNTELKTRGVMTVPVQHPITGKRRQMKFFVADTHNKAVLGIDACQEMDLITVNRSNLCAVQCKRRQLKSTTLPSPSQSSSPTSRPPTLSCRRGDVTAVRCPTEAEVLLEYPDVFKGVGLLEGEIHFDVDKSVPPVQMPLRRLPLGIRDKVRDELQRLERDGIIAPVAEHTPWVSPLLIVTKPDGRLRLCIDAKPTINKALRRATHYLPTIDDVLPQLAEVKVISTCDVQEAFFHMKLDEESSKLTTFATQFGRYRWIRCPFGVSPAPELWSARLQTALAGLKGVACIADDVIVVGAGQTETEATADHNHNLHALLNRCRERGIKLKYDKLKLNRASVVFCGHELTKQGLRPDDRKLEAISKMPPPTDRKGVQRLLGVTTYLSRYCPNFSNVTAPIRELLHRENEFHWDPQVHGVAFEKVKKLLTTPPVLAYYDPRKPTVLQADCSETACAAVLMQDGRPIEFASRALTKAEQSWAQVEKEQLALLFGLERFHTYCYCNPDLTLETDHKALVNISKKALSSAPKRLQRMLLRMQRYSYKLSFKPGAQLILADTLSRAAPETSVNDKIATEFSEQLATLDQEQLNELKMVASQECIDMIKAAALEDENYQLLMSQILSGWPSDASEVPTEIREYATFADELTVSNGFVFKGNRVVIPTGARDDILQRLHASHIGINGCVRRARETVFYPGITTALKDLVSKCAVCLRFQQETQKEPLLPHEAPERPWQKVGTDIFTHRGQDYLITVCYLTGYFEVDRIPSKRICDVIYALRQQFARYGLPEVVVSDNSPFRAAEFQRFAKKWDFSHVTISARYSQSNGRAENAVKTAKRLMTKAVESGHDPLMSLLEWRNTPSEQLGESPAFLMFGRRTRTRLPTANSLLSTPTAAAAQSALKAAKQRQKIYYDRRAAKTERPTIPVGQTVRVKHDANDWRKGEISRVLPHRSYEIQLEDGSTRRRTSRHVRFSSEPPIVIDDGATTAAVPADSPAAPSSELNKSQMSSKQTVTRSGRVVKLPMRYRE